MRISREIPRAANTVHHVRATDVRGVDIAVNVAFQRRINGNQAEPPNQLRMIANFLRSQYEARLVSLDLGQESLLDGTGQRDSTGRRKTQTSGIKKRDRAVLQNLRVHPKIREG